MPEPLNARMSDDGIRYYRWQDQELTSVTSLRRIVGMPMALHNWSLSMMRKAAVEMRTSSAVGLNDEMYGKALWRAAMLKRDTAATLGSAVHEAASDGIRPSALPDSDERKPFLIRYYEAIESLGWKVVLREAQVFNLKAGYAGSLDLIAYDMASNDYVLVDIKTGEGVYPDAALQLEMYRRSEFVGGFDAVTDSDLIDEEGTDFLHAVERMGVLQLRPEGFTWHPVDITIELTQAATDMMRFAQWVQKHPDLTTLLAR